MNNFVLNTEKIGAGELVFRIGKAEYNLLDQADATNFQETIDLLTRLVFKKTESRQYVKYHDNGTVFYVNKQTRERKFALDVGDEVVSECFLDKDKEINQNTSINNSMESNLLDLSINYLKWLHTKEKERVDKKPEIQECFEVKSNYYFANILKNAFTNLEDYKNLKDTLAKVKMYCEKRHMSAVSIEVLEIINGEWSNHDWDSFNEVFNND